MAGEGEGGRGTSGADQVFRQELAVGNRRALALVRGRKGGGGHLLMWRYLLLEANAQ
jgi:hypothetical protein